MYLISVTGTPGTGKTTFSKKLSKHFSLKYIDVSALIKEKGLSEGFDAQKNCEIIDGTRLKSALMALKDEYSTEKGLIFDSHLAHMLPKGFLDLCIVMTCPLKTLKRRLEKRGYSASKVRENLDSEIFSLCYIEAKELGHPILVVETTKVLYYYSQIKFILGL